MKSYNISDLPRANVIIRRNTLAIFKSLSTTEGESDLERFTRAFNVALRRLVGNGQLHERFGELELTAAGIKRAAHFNAEYDNQKKLRELEEIGQGLKAWA